MDGALKDNVKTTFKEIFFSIVAAVRASEFLYRERFATFFQPSQDWLDVWTIV